jgi:hypothetical protein
MGREYYLHQRHGIYYAEFIDKATGKKLSARSTGETDRQKAEIKCGVWAATGIPTGKGKKPRPIAEAAGIETIIGIIRS